MKLRIANVMRLVNIMKLRELSNKSSARVRLKRAVKISK